MLSSTWRNILRHGIINLRTRYFREDNHHLSSNTQFKTTFLSLCSRVRSSGCWCRITLQTNRSSARICSRLVLTSNMLHAHINTLQVSAPSTSQGRLAVELPKSDLTKFITSALTEEDVPHAVNTSNKEVAGTSSGTPQSLSAQQKGLVH